LQQRALAIDPVRGAEIGVGSAIENQRIAAAAAERANARLEAARLRPDNDSSRVGGLASAEQNAARATASFNEANAALQKIVASEEQAVLAAKTLAASTASADAAAKSLVASFEKLRASANQALTGLPQNVSQARQEFDGLLSQVGRLSAAGRGAATPLTNELISLFEAASNGDENIDAVITKLKQLKFVIADVGDVNAASIGAFSQNFPGNTRGNPTGPQGPAIPPGFGGRSDAGLGADIEDPGGSSRGQSSTSRT
jgi:chromosome segregation ATPase